MADSPRIVLLAFDGLPLHYVQPSVTPNLWRLGQEGGYCPEGGRSGLPSTTYPGFATLLTGAGQGKTGVRTTSHRDGAVPGWAGTDRVLIPTLVHTADQAGWRTATVMGDHKLQKVLRLDELEWSWPPKGAIPVGTELDAHGYPTNAAIRGQALEAAADPSVDVLFVHFNETDTVAHDEGPNAPITERCVRAADSLVGEVMEALAADRDRTVVAVVSDHDMARRLPLAPIDPTLGYELAGLAEDWIADGSAAWVRLTSGADHHMAIKLFSSLEGVEGWRWREPSTLLLLAAPGRVFAAPRIADAGIHGSTSTARTLAIVGGGHPFVPRFAQAIEERSPRLQDWAPTLAAVLDLELPMAEGLNLLQVRDLEAGA
jgi:hypothetical protein